MSILTSFLNLFKYDPVTDKDSTFNITTALNENWDKIDAKVEELNLSIENIEAPVTSVNQQTGDVTLSASDVGAETPSGAQSKVNALAGEGNTKTVKQIDQEIGSHLADTMPHRFVAAGKTYRYGISVVNGVVTMNYEEVV